MMLRGNVKSGRCKYLWIIRCLSFTTSLTCLLAFLALLKDIELYPPSDNNCSLALYYLTPPRPEAPKRSKALYVAAPGQPHDPELERLRHIRATRRLEPADFESV